MTHPLLWVLDPNARGRQLQVSTNTEAAARRILRHDENWLKAQVNRLRGENTTDVEATLGELRAYGACLDCHLEIKPVPIGRTKTPDFSLHEDNPAVAVEVHTRATEPRMTEKNERGTRTPYGQPRSSGIAVENVTENVIQKLATEKQKELPQLPEDAPGILWLDLQTEWASLSTESALPIIKGTQAPYHSGEFWYAAYGKKGLPIFEDGLDRREEFREPRMMRHDGLFQKLPKLSAIIGSFPDGIVLFESPRATHPVPERVRTAILHLPSLRRSRSIFHKTGADLNDRVERVFSRLERLATKKRHALDTAGR